MKKLLFLIVLLAVFSVLISCQDASVTTAQPSTTVAQTTVKSSDTEGEGNLTMVYPYSLDKLAAANGAEIEAPWVFAPSGLVTPTTEGYGAMDTDFVYGDRDPKTSVDVSKADFLGVEKEVRFLWTAESYPRFPMGYGAYSIFAYHDKPNQGFVYIRHATEKPIHIHGISVDTFADIDLNDRDAVIACADKWLQYYEAEYEGYTRFVYDEKLYEVDGISVEYNLTVGGEKSNCFVKMWLGADGYYQIELENALEDELKPYTDVPVDTARIEAMAEEQVLYHYQSHENYQLDAYTVNITYMVLHDRLVAYVVVEPSVSMTEWGRYTYGIEADEEVEVVATNMLMLVTVAEMQNAP